MTNCRCKGVSPSGKTKREQSISKEKDKKERKRESSKEKGGRCFVSAAACLPLRNTRVAAEIDSYGDPKEQKTNECFTECERARGAKRRRRACTRGRRWRAPFCVHMESAKPTLWPSPLVFTWTWPRTYLVAKPSYVHIEVAKPSLLVNLPLGCFRWCSWCLWKALDEEGCMGLVP